MSEPEFSGLDSVEASIASPFAVPLFSAAQAQTPEVPLAVDNPPASTYADLLFMAPQITTLPARPKKESYISEDPETEPLTRSRTRKRAVVVEESEETAPEFYSETEIEEAEENGLNRRRRRRRVRPDELEEVNDEVAGVQGSTRLEAKRQRRQDTRKENRRRQTITESEFLARRESVKREMIVREQNGLNQIAVLEDGLLVEHYVARRTQQTMVGNIYLGRVQNVLPSMEAAFVDLGKGRNAVLYAGEVNWEAVGLAGRPRRIEQALKSGDTVLVQVTKDPIGHKGARLTSQITLAGRYLVLVPAGQMTGISRKLPERERVRLKKLLSKIVPKDYGVIVRTAAEGATEEQLRDDVTRLQTQWEDIEKKQKKTQKAPYLLRSEPELAVRVVRDVFTEDFQTLTVQGEETWNTVQEYVDELAPDLRDRLKRWVGKEDIFTVHRIDEQLTKGMDRKVWLPSGGSLVIDRTEAMTVIDVNTGKFIGSGGTLEETVTKNNLEAAEEIVRQLRLRDIGGIVVIDFVDMVLESNRDLVLRRLVECLGRDRTRHQVTEITSLGLVQMTRKRVGEGLVEAFSTPCECCDGRGFIVHHDPVERDHAGVSIPPKARPVAEPAVDPQAEEKQEKVRSALSAIAAATASAHTEKENGKKQAEAKTKTTQKRSAEKPVEQEAEETSEKATASVVEEQSVEQTQLSKQKSEKSKDRPRRGLKDRRKGARNRLLDDAEALLDSIDTVLTVKAEEKHAASAEAEVKPARTGRRTAVMAAGQPQVVAEETITVPAVSIARPVAGTNSGATLERPVKKSRRVVVSEPAKTEETS
ncbi:Rne/Rng family ribonuclease [Gleimia sp. 6138-11-ORH1]|uniref:Rne/Rng family ribonuclease n=1 Tax=Gleimia sp. 6138-11-ORH1 TaxID=2973937 RepID=UPI002168EAAB|nr:Rne/Rng family ribonuclease [Gleimia sp. 6138-11-ORH1]MCS4484502.1 Rne/Rng family ribonuclease [Gleimia sp. 6138-11-ORH1]